MHARLIDDDRFTAERLHAGQQRMSGVDSDHRLASCATDYGAESERHIALLHEPPGDLPLAVRKKCVVRQHDLLARVDKVGLAETLRKPNVRSKIRTKASPSTTLSRNGPPLHTNTTSY